MDIGLLDAGLPEDGPPVDRDSCALLGTTGLTVQAVMAVLVMGTLVVKRYRENPQRPWPVWLADVGKQIIGQAFLHSTNVLFSTLFSHAAKRDACTAYFLSIFVDCTLGVLIIYSMLRIFSYILIERMRLKGYRTGQYYAKQRRSPSSSSERRDDLEAPAMAASISAQSGDSGMDEGQYKPGSTDEDGGETQSQRSPFQFSWWGKQLLVYLASLCVMKLAILGFFWIPAIFTVGDWMLSWLGEESKVVFVLMLFPLAMNALQFLLIDAILKSKTPEAAIATSTPSTAPPLNTSRRSSNDSDHNRHADEDRALLLDSTHDDLEAGSSLPEYQARPETAAGNIAFQPSLTLQVSRNRSQQATDVKSSAPDAQLGDSDFREPTPPVAISYEKQRNTIALQVVSQNRSPSVEHVDKGLDDAADSESNGWDWLSDDGAQSSQLEDDVRPSNGAALASQMGKTAKVA